MRIAEEIEIPLGSEERADLVVHLMEMIDHWNAGITRHQAYPEPDQMTINEFIERRNSYIQQLALLLQRYGLNFQPDDLIEQRQAA